MGTTADKKANGTLSWKAEYLFNVPITIKSISNPIQTSDVGYALTGRGIDNSRSLSLGFILRIDSSRKIVFLNTIGHSYTDGPEFAKSVNTSDGGFVVFGQKSYLPRNIHILKVNSEGVAPGCMNYVEAQQFGTTTPSLFGHLTITDAKIQPDNLALRSFDFGWTSIAVKFPFTSVCD